MPLSRRPVLAVLSAALMVGCGPSSANATEEGAGSTEDQLGAHYDATHCELFVDKVTIARSSHALLNVVLYLKAPTNVLAQWGGVDRVEYWAKLTAERDCASDNCGKWVAYPAAPWFGSRDYFSVTLTVSHDFTFPLTYEGVFHVVTKDGTNFWVHAPNGGNFFIDSALARNVEARRGYYYFLSHGQGPEFALNTVDEFPYLNPRSCR